jgi:hypothetical protein
MTIITLPHKYYLFTEGEENPASWTKEHCASYITNTHKRVELDSYVRGGSKQNMVMYIPRVEHYIEYHFGDEKDASMFAMRWAG